MYSKAQTAEDYLNQIPDERKKPIETIRRILKENLPHGFEEKMMYGMITFVVPLETYPKGYHVSKGKDPLPFMSLASQKNHIGLYHNGIYAAPEIEKWFRAKYKEGMKSKLDMGKSCIRFKNMKTIPYELLAELARKISVDEFIDLYEKAIRI